MATTDRLLVGRILPALVLLLAKVNDLHVNGLELLAFRWNNAQPVLDFVASHRNVLTLDAGKFVNQKITLEYTL